jgi:hypothetical protein
MVHIRRIVARGIRGRVGATINLVRSDRPEAREDRERLRALAMAVSLD